MCSMKGSDDPAVERFYRTWPDMETFVEALGDAWSSDDLEVTPEFYERLKAAFPAPSYDDEGVEIKGSLGLLYGVRVFVVEGLPVPWRWRDVET